MFYKNEFDFMLDVFKKSHLGYAASLPDTPICEVLSPELINLISAAVDPKLSISGLFGFTEERTLYKHRIFMRLSFILFKLPEPEERVLIIGPYLSEEISSNELLELGEAAGVPPKSQKYLEEYFLGVPVMKEWDRMFLVINSFCERAWGTPSFAVQDSDTSESFSGSSVNETESESFDDALVNIRIMEKRYAFENELIEAVRLGLLQKEAQLLTAFSESFFEKRLDDHIRNAKNYSIIMNTLLRKAAEQGGVHPIYLDKISSLYASKIEALSSLSETSELMREMFRSYCRLVRKMSIKDYSPAVQKTILIIDYDLSADLSLHTLAKEQNISAGYLSAVFKRDTGETISEYIRKRRIRQAKHLLKNTNLQVQTVALHCGIIDVQYFSKIFKRATGKTPKQYREEG